MNCRYPFQLTRKIKGSTGAPLPIVGCGKCAWCRIQRRREWTMRISHEKDYYKETDFLTLTYREEDLPEKNTLIKSDLQNFFKRLRKEIPEKIKHYSSGEYGEINERPHYHSIILGSNLQNKDYETIWGKGTTFTGTVTSDSIMYVTGYISKKQFGKKSKNFYGEKSPEFQIQSQGLGLRYLVDNLNDIIERNYVTYQGIKQSIPRYYLKKILDPKSKIATDDQRYALAKVRIDQINERKEQIEENLYGGIVADYPDKIMDLKEYRQDQAKQMDLNLKSHQRIKKQRRDNQWI